MFQEVIDRPLPTKPVIDPKLDPFTLARLIAWLRTKPPTETYCYEDNGECLLSQYFTDAGFVDIHMRTSWFKHAGGTQHLPAAFNDIALGEPRTFGAALERAT